MSTLILARGSGNDDNRRSMPRVSKIEVVKVTYSPKTPYMVRVPTELHAVENKKKRFFAKEGEAKAFRDRLRREMGNYRAQALGLSDAQKIEAADCYARLERFGRSLTDAVGIAIKYWEQAGKSITLEDLRARVIEAKRQDKGSERYVNDFAQKFGRFARDYAGALVCDITGAMIDEWLRGLSVSPVSRDSYRRNLGVAFSLAKARGFAPTNPVLDVAVVGEQTEAISILTPAELTRFLKACESKLIPYVAMAAFAGVRPDEIRRMSWGDIHFDQGIVEVRKQKVRGRGNRLVPMQPNLRAWLALTPEEDRRGAIAWSRTQFRRAVNGAGFEKWPQDALRHSYGTYRLPIIESAEKLALEMGNSPQVIFRHYRRVVKPADVKAYWEIVPT